MAAAFKLNTGSLLCSAGAGSGPEHLAALSARSQEPAELLRTGSEYARFLLQSSA